MLITGQVYVFAAEADMMIQTLFATVGLSRTNLILAATGFNSMQHFQGIRPGNSTDDYRTFFWQDQPQAGAVVKYSVAVASSTYNYQAFNNGPPCIIQAVELKS